MKLKRFAVLLFQYGLLLAGLLAAAGLSAVTTMRMLLNAQDVGVPSLIEKRVAEAGALASRHSLLVRVEGRRHDARIAADRIVAQEPQPGSRLKLHRSIRVWLSLGPERLNIPRVEGSSLRAARLALDQAGVPLARVVEVDGPAEEGIVMVQHPAAGQSERLDQGVSLLASRGPVGRDYVMPDLIGRRADEVVEGLRRAGLKVAEVRERSYPGVEPGIVLRQLPAAGHRVSPRDSVSLDVSRAAS